MRYKNILTIMGIFSVVFLMAFSTDSRNAGWFSSSSVEKPKDLYKDYKSWYQITKEPNTGDPTGFLGGMHRGENAYREIYINSVGESEHKSSAPYNYPEGTVVVKEQYKNESKWEKGSGAGLTVMVKLAQGESPETGDWGYIMPNFLSFGNPKISKGTGKTAKFCGNCHLYAAGNDYLFMNADFIKQEQASK